MDSSVSILQWLDELFIVRIKYTLGCYIMIAQSIIVSDKLDGVLW